MKDQTYNYVFLGDSLTEGGPEKEWRRLFPKSDALNMGISGDTTDGLLWRLQNDHKIEGYAPVFIILIGTNDVGMMNKPPRQTAENISKILALLKRDHPLSPILLLGLLPRGGTAQDSLRKKAQEVNVLLSACADGKNLKFLDLSPFLLDKNGVLHENLSPDLLHLSPKGYDRLVRPLAGALQELKKETP